MNVFALMKHTYLENQTKAQYRTLESAIYSAAKAGHKPVTDIDKADCVIVWGIGDPEVVKIVSGFPLVVSWDLGYFRRRGSISERGYRVSIDGLHPHVMRRNWPKDRWEKLNIPISNGWNPKGPIILAGMGYKSAKLYAEQIGEWENKIALEIKARYPKKKIVFRPKPGNDKNCQTVESADWQDGATPIRELITGASLVVCRHSNVSIDAVISGIPCIAYGGSGQDVLLDRLWDIEHRPIDEISRLRFLHNLAWYEWTLEEIRKPRMWEVIQAMVDDRNKVEIAA